MTKKEIIQKIYYLAQHNPYVEGFEKDFEAFTKELNNCPRCSSNELTTQIIGFIRTCECCKFTF